MEEWLIVKKKSHEPLNENIYASYHDAQKFIERMGETFEDTYQPYYVTDDVRVSKIVNEGLVKGDLEDIMLHVLVLTNTYPLILVLIMWLWPCLSKVFLKPCCL